MDDVELNTLLGFRDALNNPRTPASSPGTPSNRPGTRSASGSCGSTARTTRHRIGGSVSRRRNYLRSPSPSSSARSDRSRRRSSSPSSRNRADSAQGSNRRRRPSSPPSSPTVRTGILPVPGAVTLRFFLDVCFRLLYRFRLAYTACSAPAKAGISMCGPKALVSASKTTKCSWGS